MKQELTIVSGGDSNYFELLKDLLNSLLNLATRQEFNICFLDGGLKDSEIIYFKSLGVDTVDPGWPNKLSKINNILIVKSGLPLKEMKLHMTIHRVTVFILNFQTLQN